MKINKLIYIAASIVLVALLLLLFRGKSDRTSEISILTEATKRGQILNTITAIGTLEASFTVKVGTQVSGKLTKLHIDYNSKVKKGQLLAELDTDALNSTLKSSKATLDLAQAEFNFRNSIYERNKELAEKDLISQTEFEEIVFRYESAKANLDAAEAKYDKDKTNLQYAYIYSPLDGIVLEKNIEEGETVTASFETPTLFTIVNDLTQMQIEANVDEADIGQVKVGERVEFTVDAFPDETFNGQVMQIHLMPTTISNVTTYTVIINAPNPKKNLMPGMTASVTCFVSEKKDVLIIPVKCTDLFPSMEQMEQLKNTYPHLRISMPNVPPNRSPKAFNNFQESPSASDYQENEAPQPEDAENNLKRMVWIKENDIIYPRLIEIGLSDDFNCEVTKGLSEGTEVITAIKNNIAENEHTSSSQKTGSPFMPKPPQRNKR